MFWGDQDSCINALSSYEEMACDETDSYTVMFPSRACTPKEECEKPEQGYFVCNVAVFQRNLICCDWNLLFQTGQSSYKIVARLQDNIICMLFKWCENGEDKNMYLNISKDLQPRYFLATVKVSLERKPMEIYILKESLYRKYFKNVQEDNFISKFSSEKPFLPSKILALLSRRYSVLSFEFCVLKHVQIVLRKTFLFSEPL